MKLRSKTASYYYAIHRRHDWSHAAANDVIKYSRTKWFAIVNDWLKVHRHDFVVPLARVKWKMAKSKKGRKRSSVQLYFTGLTPNLSFYLDDRYQCVVLVMLNQVCIDSLFCSDIYPSQKTNGGWFDALASDSPNHETELSTRTAPLTLGQLAQTQMLDPLLEWFNDQVKAGRWLCCFTTHIKRGSTWASLEDDSLYHRLCYQRQLCDLSGYVDESRKLYRLYPLLTPQIVL